MEPRKTEEQLPLQPRTRTDSSASKRMREANEDEEREHRETRPEDISALKKVLSDYLENQCLRLSREQVIGINKIFDRLGKLVLVEQEKRICAEGVLKGWQLAMKAVAEERAPRMTEQKSYREALKMPKVGRKPVEKRDPEKVVIVYPTDETQTDAEKRRK